MRALGHIFLAIVLAIPLAIIGLFVWRKRASLLSTSPAQSAAGPAEAIAAKVSSAGPALKSVFRLPSTALNALPVLGDGTEANTYGGLTPIDLHLARASSQNTGQIPLTAATTEPTYGMSSSDANRSDTGGTTQAAFDAVPNAWPQDTTQDFEHNLPPPLVHNGYGAIRAPIDFYMILPDGTDIVHTPYPEVRRTQFVDSRAQELPYNRDQVIAWLHEAGY